MVHDLFGEVPPAARDDNDLVEVVLLEHAGSSTDRAWALYAPPKGALKFAPRSRVARAEPSRPNVWKMPRWLAKERGWL